MTTTTLATYDGAGNLVETRQVEVSEYVLHRDALEQQIRAALAALTAIIDTPQATFTTLAQAQAQMRTLQGQVKDEARILRRLIRLQVGDYSGSD